MQKKEQIKPLFLDLDTAYSELKPYNSPFLKGLTFDVNKNPVNNIGTNNPTGQGQNSLVQSTVRSNAAVPNVLLPDGHNKNIGAYESTTTRDFFYLNYNINGQHGIYVLNGDTGLLQTVIIDPELQFTDNQENFIANHRVLIRFIEDKNKNIIEKYLLITDGNSWHKYINVIAAIKSNGFDSSLYPYWNLKPPHFDRRELLEWAVRPPMVKPVISTVPNTDADKGKLNRFLDKGLQVAISFQNTDGRISTLSPYSLPLLIKSEDFLNNPDNIPKNVKIKLVAGSPLTEKINIYVRSAKKGTNSLQSIQNWGDWFLYDTIKKFHVSNPEDVLSTNYWLRTDAWASYNYDVVFNTLEYNFDLSKVQQIVIDQEYINYLQTEMPQLSIALSDIGDGTLLGDNRYGYPNFSDDVMGGISAEVIEKTDSSCPVPLRKIRLYAYIARCGDDFTYTSQVGYYNSDDKKMLFGGLLIGGSNVVGVEIDETTTFGLNFGDKKALRCYLKGTPYFADGEWYKVNSDNSLVKLPALLDIREISVKQEIQDVFVSQGYYVCVFDIDAPAGKYIACLGRHNVDSSGDFRDTSTYVYGIANSRVKSVSTVPGAASTITSIKPNAINNGNGILYSKEMEIDCTNGDVDVWGNNHDLFYVYCPYITKRGNKAYRFIEGYFKYAEDNKLPVELFPYRMNHNATDDWGRFTDKNGFYWAYTKVANSSVVDIQFVAKINCQYPTIFSIPTSSSGIGWKQNTDNFLSNNNGNNDSNRVLIKGKVTSLDGNLNYSNIAFSIKDGATVYTNSNGEFTLILHNGQSIARSGNVYVNAGGSFFITTAGCGQVPLFNYNESLVSCIYPATTPRAYPIQFNLLINISTDSQTSLKENVKYSTGIYGADLAGRLMYVNVIEEIPVPSFLSRDNLKATFLRLLFSSGFNLTDYPDIKWITPCVSKNVSIKRFTQWVGDGIEYIDSNGNTVTDPSSAATASIKINSLYNANVSKNFSLLSAYQFAKNDRIRILDDGDGNLLNIETYGDPIDLEILGTNYVQAAIDSGLLQPLSNTVLSTQATSPDVRLIVRYDSRLNKLIDKTGFWIEVYTPTEQSDIVPFYEDGGFYPIINGKPAIFKGYSNGKPIYDYITSLDLDFWDTYFFDRNITIPGVGNKYFSHPFESENVTDNWGADIISGGRTWIKNDNAKQYWLPGETIKSDNFIKEGLINGLATFRGGNKKDFGSYPFGGITAMHTERNVIAFICENDWFVTDYNFHNAFLNEQGVLVANLDDGLSTPHQKIGSMFGMAKVDTGTFISHDKNIYFYDRKNTAIVRMDYRDALDVSVKSESEQGGMQSFINAKTDFITSWNNSHDKENSFDIISGVDVQLSKIYLTFRPRRGNSNEIYSYINNRRNWQLNFQETIVYDTINRGWLRSEGFTPEGYGSLRGNGTGTQLISFAAGKPYFHNAEGNGFNEFYGQQTTPIIIGCFNQDNTIEKVFEAMYYTGNPNGWYVDYMYTDFKNSFSYLSKNKFEKLLNNYYAAIQTNANSYPSNQPEELFRSMFVDGYRNKGKYIIFRMVCGYETLNDYTQIGAITGLITQEDSNKK